MDSRGSLGYPYIGITTKIVVSPLDMMITTILVWTTITVRT